jgi:hypothetical protein
MCKMYGFTVNLCTYTVLEAATHITDRSLRDCTAGAVMTRSLRKLPVQSQTHKYTVWAKYHPPPLTMYLSIYNLTLFIYCNWSAMPLFIVYEITSIPSI